ncbi:MAG: hypothetical protein M0D57_01960 [Sphingobacteriales bacterium JAD_PAG50586_3]|nr:MAG: hypothetical protein M0D57_01960 [Sphingobacteriales bacterium JAD_PAG50586_3]
MEIIRINSFIDSVLSSHASVMGADMEKYRNHVYRVFNFSLYFNKGEDADLLAIAAAFHDIGIWTDKTFDYLDPSIKLAVEYVNARPELYLSPEKLAQVIELHHKITRVKLNTTAEHFRRGDIADLTFGLIRFGMPKALYKEAKAVFPIKGFHWKLVKLTLRQLTINPLKPLPMFRW